MLALALVISQKVDSMEAKIYLAQIRKYEVMIRNKCERIQQLQDEAMKISPFPTDGTKVKTSFNVDRHEDIICSYLQMEQEIKQEIEKYYLLKQKAIRLFEQLPATQYDILYQVHILGRSLKEAAIYADRSYSWATMTQNQAIKGLQKLLDDMDATKQTAID